jgi:hypothetical protein
MVMAKEILCAFSVDFDAVSVWLGTFGGEKSPSGISRGVRRRGWRAASAQAFSTFRNQDELVCAWPFD